MTWTYLADTVEAGDTSITLKNGVNWKAGSEIVIATTGDRASMGESEVAVIDSVSDDGTNNFLKTLVEDSYAWIGGFLNESSSTWMWSDGTTWQYENWFDGQPNNGGGVQTHVAMNFESSGQWNDEYKNGEKSFVCHYKGSVCQKFSSHTFTI